MLREARASGPGFMARETEIMMKAMRKSKTGRNTLGGQKDPFFRDYIQRFEDWGAEYGFVIYFGPIFGFDVIFKVV